MQVIEVKLIHHCYAYMEVDQLLWDSESVKRLAPPPPKVSKLVIFQAHFTAYKIK